MTARDDHTAGSLASRLLDRFLQVHPVGGEDEFESWAEQQAELNQGPELRIDVQRLLQEWLCAAKLLALNFDSDSEGIVFRRRSRDRKKQKAPGKDTEALREGRKIGSFILTRFIAKGGMGQVWEAEDEELRRKVALKLVLPDRIEERSLELFAREARAGGRLCHPNLVTTLAYGTDEGLPWIAQELIEGSWTVKDSLDALRAEDSVPKDYYREVAKLVARIADGLQAVHDAGVIHRDLKPQNILVTDDDQPKVTDFGLARVSDDSFLSQTGDFGGTWAYMSPEQVTAKRMGLDHRTDVFSLGVVLYELLTLRRPFEGDTTHQIAAQIIGVDPPDAAKVRSQCPHELAVICGKALEKFPDRRYGSMAELAADLRRHLADEPILAKPPGPLVRWMKWVRRHPAISSAGAIAIVALVVVSLLSLNLAATAENLREQTKIAQDNERVAEDRASELERQVYLTTIASALAAFRNNDIAATRRLLESAPEERRAWEWSHLEFISDRSLVTITGHDDQVNTAMFAPDGETVLTASNDATVRLWDWNRGSELRRFVDHEGSVYGARFDASGEVFLSSASDGTARLSEVWGGDPVMVLSGVTYSNAGAYVDSDALWVVTKNGFTSHDRAGGVAGASLDKGVEVIARHRDDQRHWVLDRYARIVDVTSGERVVQLAIDERRIADGAFDILGQYVAIALFSHEVLVFETSGGRVVWRLDGHSDYVTGVAFSPDGEKLATASSDKSVRLWDLGAGELLVKLRGHTDAVHSVAFSPIGDQIVTASADGTARVWSTESLPEQVPLRRDSTFRAHDMPDGSAMLVEASFAKDMSRVVCSVDAATAQVRDLDVHTAARELGGHDSVIRITLMSPDGRFAFTSTWNGMARIWNAATGVPVATLPKQSRFLSAAFSADGELLATACRDGEFVLWGTRTGREHVRLRGHGCKVFGPRFSSDGGQLLARADNGTVRIWSTRDGLQDLVLAGMDQRIKVAEFSPDGLRVVAGDVTGSLRIWDSTTGESQGVVKASDQELYALRFSPDGRWLAAGGKDGRARVWSAKSLELQSETDGHTEPVLRLGFHPDSDRLVTASVDGTARLWDVFTGTEVAVFRHDASWPMMNAAFSPDGRILLTEGLADSILWSVGPTQDALGHAR